MSTGSTGTEFTIRRKVLSFLGAKFHIYDSNDKLIGFSKQKAFKLKEDIRLYTDESMDEERLIIQARKVIDFSAAYDVVDSKKDKKIGALQRKGLKSILRDEWIVLDGNDGEIGTIKEDSTGMALVRRFLPLGKLIPQKFMLRDADGNELALFRTHFNLFVHRMTVTVYPESTISPYLILAGGLLLVAIEGRNQ
ncbi:MAG: hypothetical protein HOL01_16040 [Planctomycetaceae bacterium]|jgi:hypothetical protein|nr:hypothetical protein [Planctomycetaceae bacterium]MBT6486850.1 hypothetical protein [Planctomycetaceae bacterium]MBT6496058.1 hypothetical protein [Planctomycetaceae bacterium]